MQKKIIFGAGVTGKRALAYFGECEVYAFADNSVVKQGKVMYGKQVLSFEELLEDTHQCKIVIASIYYNEIAKQLREHGISEFELFLNQKSYEMISEFDEEMFRDDKTIVIYGATEFAVQIYKQFEIHNIQQKIAAIIQYDDLAICETIFCGHEVKRFEEIENADCFIIADVTVENAITIKIENSKFNSAKILNLFRRKIGENTVLVYNKYEDPWFECKDEKAHNARRASQTNIHRAINARTKELYQNLPYPQLIEIEIINRCNGYCEFCPVNKNSDTRPFHQMEEELFKDIIAQLKEINYAGMIDLFGNSEPLLDDRIYDFYEHMRKELPKAYIVMYTNGILLTVTDLCRLLPNVDLVVIDNYRQDLKLLSNVKDIVEYCKGNPETIKKVRVDIRKPKEILNTRAGNAPNRKEQAEYPNVSCTTVFDSMLIRPTGEVSLCCNDALGQMTLGDLRKEKLLDIWYGSEFDKIRKKMLAGRTNIPICKYCDNIPVTKGSHLKDGTRVV